MSSLPLRTRLPTLLEQMVVTVWLCSSPQGMMWQKPPRMWLKSMSLSLMLHTFSVLPVPPVITKLSLAEMAQSRLLSFSSYS